MKGLVWWLWFIPLALLALSGLTWGAIMLDDYVTQRRGRIIAHEIERVCRWRTCTDEGCR